MKEHNSGNNKFNQIIWGESPRSFYFSFQGTFNRLQFFGALVTLNIFFKIIAEQGIFFLTLFCGLIIFYASLAAIQKRCRDIKQRGTIFILIFSMAYPINLYLRYMKEQNLIIGNNTEKVLGVVIGLYLLVYLFLLFMPGAKEKDLNLTSPLLNYPKTYFMICIAICFFVFFVWGY